MSETRRNSRGTGLWQIPLLAEAAGNLRQVTDQQPQDDRDDLPEQMRVRMAKLERLRAAGVDPYPVGFPRTTTIAALREKYAGLDP